MEAVSVVLQWSQNLAFLLVAVWALRRWRHTGTEHSRWLAMTFGALAVVVSGGIVTELMWGPDPADTPALVGRLLSVGIAVFPYLLLRFLDSFQRVPAWFRRAAEVVVVVTALCSLLLPLPDDGATLSVAFLVLLVAFTVDWLGVLPVVSVRFWRAGSGQPTLVRRRLRTLAVAAASIGLSLLLLIGGSVAATGEGAPTSEVTGLTLAVQLFALLAAGSFLVGFAPPAPLKSAWRQFEERQLHRASVGLMEATTPDEVGDLLVPHVRDVIAAEAVALVHEGELLATVGVTDHQRRALASGSSASITYALSTGELHVWTNSFTPFFGEDDLELIQQLSVLTDLALARSTLLASEHEARVDLEAANAELESFVYSASHDLKSPLIAIQSYLDVLVEEAGPSLGGDASFYVDRMRSNAQYMEALVGDLLELSRVGRVDVAAERIDLGELVRDVTEQVGDRFPGLWVHVGDLPSPWMNALRCRQLFRNLLENAASHGTDDEVQVWIESRPSEDVPGGVVVLVRDDGAGIPEAYRERVFGVFERLHADGADGSTGIGLAICRKIVETLGGRMWVTDRPGGAEFAILLPPAVLHPDGATTTDHVAGPGDDATMQREVPA